MRIMPQIIIDIKSNVDGSIDDQSWCPRYVGPMKWLILQPISVLWIGTEQ